MSGRDIQDRLNWQNELYKELSGTIPMPKIYGLFQEKGYSVLVMEYIKGKSLYDKLMEVNCFSTIWRDLPVVVSLKLLDYVIEITKIIQRMHEKGYVHRDIVPVNFLIDKKDKIKLIDIELAYSLKNKTPNPPFRLGTFGFMSPEQAATRPPRIQEDIYGLGGTLLHAFLGLLPIKFNSENREQLLDTLSYFTNNNEIATIVADSLHPHPNFRPTTSTILAVLLKYQKELQSTLKEPTGNHCYKSVDELKLKEIISSALNGLTKSPIVTKKDLWCSKHLSVQNYTAPQNKEYAINPGLREGLCGVLYALARIYKTKISVDSCKANFTKALKLLEDRYSGYAPEISSGLYNGAAGFALVLNESISSGLINDNEINRNKITLCLTLSNDKVDLANGVTGQGLSALLCRNYLPKDIFQEILHKIVGRLLNRQQKDGSWIQPPKNKKGKSHTIFNMGYDDSGIIWFLLEYIALYPNTEAQNAVIQSLENITTHTNFLNNFHTLVASKESYEFGDGGKGLIVMLIKAYETLKDERYGKMAENALHKYPKRIINGNFTQESGLAGIGEIYLEAWRVFKNEEWKHRADWIANVFIHSFFRTTSVSGYWVMEQNNPPTADFLVGNSGIIHFLVRCLNYDAIGYRLLK
jgi:serine/threonine protein kinase